jgi:hypothetical protein
MKTFLTIEYKMSDIMNTLYGPLGSEYCVWFYGLSILGFLSLLFLLFSTIAYGISKKKGFEFYFTILPVALSYGIFYFQNRLL